MSQRITARRAQVLMSNDELRDSLRIREDVRIVAVVPNPVMDNVSLVVEGELPHAIVLGHEEPPVYDARFIHEAAHRLEDVPGCG